MICTLRVKSQLMSQLTFLLSLYNIPNARPRYHHHFVFKVLQNAFFQSFLLTFVNVFFLNYQSDFPHSPPAKLSELDDCCKLGFKWDRKLVGHEVNLDKNKVYITGSNKHAAVLLIHDIFGWKFPNLRFLVNHFTKEANCTCYISDFYATIQTQVTTSV